MSEPVFYTPDKWEVDDVYFESNSQKEKDIMEKDDEWHGSMYLKVGEYGNHSIFIRPEIDILASNDFEFNDKGEIINTIDVYIHAFPQDGTYIFNFEEMNDPVTFEREMDAMWNEHEKVCDQAWRDIDDYFNKHEQELLDIFFNKVKEFQPQEYEKYVKLSNEYVNIHEDIDQER